MQVTRNSIFFKLLGNFRKPYLHLQCILWMCWDISGWIHQATSVICRNSKVLPPPGRSITKMYFHGVVMG